MLLRFKSLSDIYVIKKNIPVDEKMQTNDLKARKNIFVHSFPARSAQNKVYNPRFI